MPTTAHVPSTVTGITAPTPLGADASTTVAS